jgi:hypothetical protein
MSNPIVLTSDTDASLKWCYQRLHFATGPGMEVGLRAQRGGRLHAVRPGTGTPAEIEEERRLLYVAMTRAKDTLQLITPRRFFTPGQPSLGDRHVYAARSRFIPGSLLTPFESVTWPILATEAAGRQRSVRFVSMSARACAACGGEGGRRCVF